MGLDTFKLLVLLLLLEGDLNCSLQQKKGLGVTLGICGRQSCWEVRAQLPLSCCPALSHCSSSLPHFSQNRRSNAAGLYSLSWGRITNYSSGSVSEHRFMQYRLILFPSCKTLFQDGDLFADIPVPCFLSERQDLSTRCLILV